MESHGDAVQNEPLGHCNIIDVDVATIKGTGRKGISLIGVQEVARKARLSSVPYPNDTNYNVYKKCTSC